MVYVGNESRTLLWESVYYVKRDIAVFFLESFLTHLSSTPSLMEMEWTNQYCTQSVSQKITGWWVVVWWLGSRENGEPLSLSLSLLSLKNSHMIPTSLCFYLIFLVQAAFLILVYYYVYAWIVGSLELTLVLTIRIIFHNNWKAEKMLLWVALHYYPWK